MSGSPRRFGSPSTRAGDWSAAPPSAGPRLPVTRPSLSLRVGAEHGAAPPLACGTLYFGLGIRRIPGMRVCVRGGSRIFIGEGLQDLGAPFWLLKGRLCHERCQCTTTKIMHVGIIRATPLASGPYIAHLDCAFPLMPGASPWWAYDAFKPKATLRPISLCELTSIEGFKRRQRTS